MTTDEPLIAEGAATRPVKDAVLRGFLRRCPHCGEGALFDGYLTVRHACPSCGEALHHHRADDGPAWLTMIVVAHLVIPMVLVVMQAWTTLPLWAHSAMWMVVASGLTFALLPRFKGVIVAFQWAQRMHGFALEPAHGA